MQYNGGGDQFSSTVLAQFTKNASYSDNYHNKYYYTKLVRQRVAARRRLESERPEFGSISGLDEEEDVGSDPDENGAERHHRLPGSVPSTPEPVEGAPPSSGSGGSGWYLSTGAEPPPLDPETAPYGEHLDQPVSGRARPDFGSPSNRANGARSGDRSSRAMADSKEERHGQQQQQQQPLVTDANWEPIERSSAAAGFCSDSVTSDDSVFSEEDYAAMTDSPDSGRTTSRWMAPPDGTDDADSSFSSPGGSTSTLEADGKEDGGGHAEDSIKDVQPDRDDDDGEDVGVIRRRSGSPPASTAHHRPNIRLILGQPVDDVDDSPSPPTAGHNDDGSYPTDADGRRRPTTESDPDAATSTPTTTMMKKSESNSFYEDREFDFLKTEPVRRSTSLKTYKTPPGTPHRKKAVRFADALGLDLESVRHILNLEEPPEVPKSAIRHLEVGLQEENRTDGVKYLSALFGQPGADPNFRRRVDEAKVVLENCVVDDRELTISGTVRVANIAYQKLVVVRYTTNGWLSSEDVVASYVQNSNDGPTDRFSFTIAVPKYFAVGQRLEFAVMYTAGGSTYWDNNHGANYIVECYARALPLSESDNTWMHFL